MKKKIQHDAYPKIKRIPSIQTGKSSFPNRQRQLRSAFKRMDLDATTLNENSVEEPE